MLKQPKKDRKKEITCYADYVVDVPLIIVNRMREISYERLHFIGSGSYGKCYQVVKQNTKEIFACKIVSKELGKDSTLRHLIQNEVKVHSILKHEHVVEYIQSFDDEKFVYMIQSLCTNQSLRDLQKSRGTITTYECRYFINQILKGAEYIHDHKIIHRDLKLSNILIDKNMQMKICDFGLSIHLNDPRLKASTLCGTTNYLAPEIVGRQGFVCRSDVWAIGVMAFILLFGYKPFEEADAYGTHQRILRADYTLSNDIDSDLKFFFRSVFEKKVEFRCSSTECLKFAFFKKYDIPHSLPVQTFTQASFSEANKIETSLTIAEFDFSSNVFDVKSANIEYPEINLLNEIHLHTTSSTEELISDLELNLFTQFDSYCRHHMNESDFSISDINETSGIKPPYFISKWTYNNESSKGFTYEMSDGLKGMLFFNGVSLLKTPDKVFWIMTPNDDTFWKIDEFSDVHRLDQYKAFCDSEQLLDRNGIYIPETVYNHRKKVYLHTWLCLNNGNIMLLSNGMVQINLVKNHQKILICPTTETITFIEGRISLENYKTLTFERMKRLSFSLKSFHIFPFITSVLLKLIEAIKE